MARKGPARPLPKGDRPCPHCGAALRIILERSATVFFVCDACGTRGAYSTPERPSDPKA